MPRKRWLVVLAIVIGLLVGVEIVVRTWERPKAVIQIINEGGGLMEDLVVRYADTRVPVGTLLQGNSALLSLTSGPLGPLRLEYRQKTNALQGFEIPDFDPAVLIQDGYKQVLVVGPNQIQRYAEAIDPNADRRSVGQTILEWLRADFKP